MNLLSWGLYPHYQNKKILIRSTSALKEALEHHKAIIPFGNGRSYGDSAINDSIAYLRPLDNIIHFDSINGIIHCQSGVLLKNILDICIPSGWFLKITPGTKLVTVGGAIASDVHGKNHHIEGCFSESLIEFNIMLSNGEIVNCNSNDELFLATCGGMGLTGIIIDAKISLKRIKSTNINQTTIKTKNLMETFEAFENFKTSPYSVAWIDCLATKKNIGKCILMVGDFSNDGIIEIPQKRKFAIPFTFPSFVLNKLTVQAFNWLYYFKAPNGVSRNTVSFESFFYPLDGISNWNRIYGKNGFTQYQFILPLEHSYSGLLQILNEISDSGMGSFLAVLKLYSKENKNYLSFPMEGYSLALDFKIEDGLFELLDRLDTIVLKHHGRIYLSKDVRVTKETFEKGYPMIEKFRKFRKDNKSDLKFNSLQSMRVKI